MKFSFHFPVGHTGAEFQSLEAIEEMATALERAGVDACNLTDHPAPDSEWLHANGHDALDPFAALAFVAAKSTTLMLHTAILVLPYRNPFITAKAAATLQVLSNGRLILGVGAGYQKSEFDALGVDFHKRGALMDDAIDTMRRAWAGGSVAKQGLGYTAIGNEPRPAPSPAPPIWIGGGSPKAIERAVRSGDGWNPFFATPSMSKLNQETGIQSLPDFRQKVAVLHEMRATLGRSDPFDVAADPRIDLGARTRADAQRCIETLLVLEEAGLTWAVFDPLTGGQGTQARAGGDSAHLHTRAAYIEAVQWLGEEIVAPMRG